MSAFASLAALAARRPPAALAAALAALEAERERWPLWIPVAFGAGIGIYFALAAEPPRWTGLAVLAAALAAALVLRQRPAPLLAAIGLAALAAGFAAAQLRTAMVEAPVLGREIGPVRAFGTVVEMQPLPTGYRLLLQDLEIAGLPADATPRRARLRVLTGEPPGPGDRIAVRLVLGPPDPPAAPGSFDFQRYAFFKQIGATGHARGAVERIAPPPEAAGFGLRGTVAGLRHAVTQRLLAALGGEAGAVAAALVTGHQPAIPRDVLEAMRDSGLAHLLSISGLHMSLVAGILFFGLRAVLALMPPVALRYPTKKWAAAAALAGSFFYLFLSGSPIPAQRAFLMTALVMVAVLADRSALSMRLVAWAALLVLLLAPESLVGPSFQMSFAAVVALIAAYEARRERRQRRPQEAPGLRRLLRYPADIAFASLIAGAATTPFALYHFNRFALYGVAANMLAVPLTGLWVMPWAVVGLLLMPFGLERIGLIPMGWGIDGVVAIARAVAGWPGAAGTLPAMPVWGLVAVALGGLWLCLWQRPWRWLGLSAVAVGMAAIALQRPPDLLVSGDGRLIAVRNAEGELVLSTRRSGRREAETWLRRAGQAEGSAWPRLGTTADGLLACDALGCIYRPEGRVVAIAWEADALAEDCHVAEIVVSLEPVRQACPSASVVIDRFDLWRDGGHALWLTGGRTELRSVRAARGDRPWVLSPLPRQATTDP